MKTLRCALTCTYVLLKNCILDAIIKSCKFDG